MNIRQLIKDASSGFLKTKEEVKEWLDRMGAEDYTINQDLTVDVNGRVRLFQRGLTSIPVQFGTISGNFDCGNNELTSLEGCPKEVGRSFYCDYNHLTSLQGAPKVVGRDFDCSFNNLESLEGCPIKVKGDFDCADNELTSLEGCPKEVEGGFRCGYNAAKFTEEDVKSVSNVKGEIVV